MTDLLENREAIARSEARGSLDSIREQNLSFSAMLNRWVGDLPNWGNVSSKRVVAMRQFLKSHSDQRVLGFLIFGGVGKKKAWKGLFKRSDVDFIPIYSQVNNHTEIDAIDRRLMQSLFQSKFVTFWPDQVNQLIVANCPTDNQGPFRPASKTVIGVLGPKIDMVSVPPL